MPALHDAAREGRLDDVVKLLEAGADVNALDSDVYTPLGRAAMGGHTGVVAALLAEGAEPDGMVPARGQPLSEAAFGGHLDAVRLLLDAGAHVVGLGRASGLHAAARAGRRGAVVLCYLLSRLPAGTKVDALRDAFGGAPLPYACAAPTASATGIKALLAHGASVDVINNWGHTPESRARQDGRLDVLDLLARHRERPFTVDDVPHAFAPELLGDPLWQVDQMVAYWATRTWGCGAAGVQVAVGASSGTSSGGGAAWNGDTGAAGSGVAPATTASDDDSGTIAGRPDSDELAPAPYNIGLPQKVVFWQSMPRNVVALTAELTADLAMR